MTTRKAAAGLSTTAVLVSAALAWAVVHAAPARAQRVVAVTIDDLPVNSLHHDLETWQAITGDLLRALIAHGVPATGFVNEGKLYVDGELESGRRALLESWIEAGLDLGNHGYSHLDLNRTPLEEYQADLLRGEEVTRPLLEQAGKELRYFRHPFLHAGTDLETRDALLAFLDRHGYREAPVTIDNSEWIFARAYENALDEKNEAMATRIGAEYVPYMERMFEHLERQARELFGRDIPQVLLLHANRLNADYFGVLAESLVERGYRFAPLDEVLGDPAYESPDRWVGRGGITWLHRWALTSGVDREFFAGEPTAPAFVLDVAGIETE